jgi:hypothetical protein
MFGNNNLLKDGIQASGIVLSAKEYDRRGDSGGYSRVHLDLEVHFADGTKTTVSLKAKIGDVGLIDVGQIVPVRYDDNDHSKVEIDTPAITAKQTALREARQAYEIARSEAKLKQAGGDQ